MDTMFLLYTNEEMRARQTEQDMAIAMAEHRALTAQAVAQGKFRGASRRRPQHVLCAATGQ